MENLQTATDKAARGTGVSLGSFTRLSRVTGVTDCFIKAGESYPDKLRPLVEQEHREELAVQCVHTRGKPHGPV